MGRERWSPGDWKTYRKREIDGRSKEKILNHHGMQDELDPRNIDLRESRDSEHNPESNAIIIAFDQTGSMGDIPDAFVRTGLETLVEEILKRDALQDPHIMIMGIGDAWYDRAPLQATQFETDIEIGKQLKKIYLEGGGGNNTWESYNLAWYFAACKTSIDCWEKRRRKGYLFTIGDEKISEVLKNGHVKKVFGEELDNDKDLDSRDVLAMASRSYHVFHFMVEQGSFYRRQGESVRQSWSKVLGQNAMRLSDYEKLAECVVSAIQVCEGNEAEKVAKSWTGDTSIGGRESGRRPDARIRRTRGRALLSRAHAH